MKVRFEAGTLFEGLIADGDPPCSRVGLADTSTGDYVVLQRGLPIGGPRDRGVYVEVNDPRRAGYDRISSCEITPDGMVVRLSAPPGERNPVRSVEVTFKPDLRPTPEFLTRLRAIFGGHESRLRVSDG